MTQVIDFIGGEYRNRTGVHGFAIRCVTTPPTRPVPCGAVLLWGSPVIRNPSAAARLQFSATGLRRVRRAVGVPWAPASNELFRPDSRPPEQHGVQAGGSLARISPQASCRGLQRAAGPVISWALRGHFTVASCPGWPCGHRRARRRACVLPFNSFCVITEANHN